MRKRKCAPHASRLTPHASRLTPHASRISHPPFSRFPFPAFLLQSAPLMQDVLNYLEENQSRFVRELCDYLRYPSVSAQSHHRKDLEAAARWLVQHCQSIGLNARLCLTEGNPVVVADTPTRRSASARRRRHFLVYGHYDVQPAEP